MIIADPRSEPREAPSAIPESPECPMPTPPQTPPPIPNGVLLRDLLIFQAKLWMDGAKDLFLSPLSVGAAVLDAVLGPKPGGKYRLYSILKVGERFDLWLNLYGAAQAAEQTREGLFGASEPGDGTMLGRMEELSDGRRTPFPVAERPVRERPAAEPR